MGGGQRQRTGHRWKLKCNTTAFGSEVQTDKQAVLRIPKHHCMIGKYTEYQREPQNKLTLWLLWSVARVHGYRCRCCCWESSAGSLDQSRETAVEDGKVELPRWFFPCSPEVTSSSKTSFLFLPFPHSHSSSGCVPHVNKQLLNRLGFLVRSPSLPSSFTRYNSIFSVSAPLFRIRPPLECASDCFHPFLLLLKNPPSLFPL